MFGILSSAAALATCHILGCRPIDEDHAVHWSRRCEASRFGAAVATAVRWISMLHRAMHGGWWANSHTHTLPFSFECCDFCFLDLNDAMNDSNTPEKADFCRKHFVLNKEIVFDDVQFVETQICRCQMRQVKLMNWRPPRAAPVLKVSLWFHKGRQKMFADTDNVNPFQWIKMAFDVEFNPNFLLLFPYLYYNNK